MSDRNIFTRGPAEKDEPIDPFDSKKTFDKFMEQAGMEMAWEVTRDDPDPDSTFSQDAVTGLRNSIGVFIGSRVVRKWRATKRAPKKIQVHVTVSVDGEPLKLEPNDIPYITWSDGEHRAEGMKRK